MFLQIQESNLQYPTPAPCLAEVDLQHRNIIAMLNQLAGEIAAGATREQIQAAFDELMMRTVECFATAKVAIGEAWQQTERVYNDLQCSVASESERRHGLEIKNRVAEALLGHADGDFPQRIERALAELSKLPGLHPEGGLWFRTQLLQSRGFPDGWVGHGHRIWQRPLPRLAPGAIDIVSLCTHAPGVEHGHYFVSTAQFGEEIGLLVLDTVINPPADPVRLDLLTELGSLFALAIRNEYAMEAQEIAVEHELKSQQAQREVERLKERERLAAQAMSQGRLATLGEMATGMMHEINQPLTYISAALQTLRRAQKKGTVIPDEKRAELYDEGLRQISRITRIMQYLRDFGRGDEPERVQPTSLTECLDHTLAMLGKRLEVANVHLTVAADARLPYIRGDDSALEQVFANLFLNALEALEGREDKRLTVTLKAVADAVEIQISDNGHGMTDEVRAHCFDPFFTTREMGSGAVGVGLSTVHGIITRHHGKVSVVSTPGEGTTFTLWLPAAEGMA